MPQALTPQKAGLIFSSSHRFSFFVTAAAGYCLSAARAARLRLPFFRRFFRWMIIAWPDFRHEIDCRFCIASCIYARQQPIIFISFLPHFLSAAGFRYLMFSRCFVIFLSFRLPSLIIDYTPPLSFIVIFRPCHFFLRFRIASLTLSSFSRISPMMPPLFIIAFDVYNVSATLLRRSPLFDFSRLASPYFIQPFLSAFEYTIRLPIISSARCCRYTDTVYDIDAFARRFL